MTQPGNHQPVRLNNDLGSKQTNKDWEKQYQSAPHTPATPVTAGEVSITLPGTPELSTPVTPSTPATHDLLPFHNYK